MEFVGLCPRWRRLWSSQSPDTVSTEIVRGGERLKSRLNGYNRFKTRPGWSTQSGGDD